MLDITSSLEANNFALNISLKPPPPPPQKKNIYTYHVLMVKLLTCFVGNLS